MEAAIARQLQHADTSQTKVDAAQALVVKTSAEVATLEVDLQMKTKALAKYEITSGTRPIQTNQFIAETEDADVKATPKQLQ